MKSYDQELKKQIERLTKELENSYYEKWKVLYRNRCYAIDDLNKLDKDYNLNIIEVEQKRYQESRDPFKRWKI